MRATVIKGSSEVMIDSGAPRPAAIIGFPVGFVGAAESKDALHANPRGIAYATLLGRKGGSAMAASVINALTLSPALSAMLLREPKPGKGPIAAFFRLLASIADAIAEAIEPIPPTPEDKDA
jgi:hypothetical protein